VVALLASKWKKEQGATLKKRKLKKFKSFQSVSEFRDFLVNKVIDLYPRELS